MPDLGYRISGFGWLKDYPSIRDYSPQDAVRKLGEGRTYENIQKVLLPKAEWAKPADGGLPEAVDNRKWCSPVRDQSSLGSCTAFMATGMYEYMCSRGHSKYVQLSPLFTYKTTRWLMHVEGDTGAYIRSAIGSLVIYGAPPEEYYPYRIDRFDRIPDTLNTGFAQSFQALKYFRLDKGIPSDKTLVDRMKEYIYKGFCLGIGFTVFESYTQADSNGGYIPYPKPNEEVVGGHAVHLVGYTNKGMVNNDDCFIFKNSWGDKWGDGRGYGYIPTKYFMTQEGMDAPLADDIWCITKYEWLNLGDFGFNE